MAHSIGPAGIVRTCGIVNVQSETKNQHGDDCQRLVARLDVFRRMD